MDQPFNELIRGAPYLGAVVFLVMSFLTFLRWHLEKMETRNERMLAALDKSTEMLGRCLERLNNGER